MEIINFSKLSKEEKKSINTAKNIAKKSASDLGHQVGCLVKCKNGKEYFGATNVRSRTIGSTCAERMALDQMIFDGNKNPVVCVLIGRFPQAKWRKKWSEDNICTPCGVCLETWKQVIQMLNLKDLNFLCSSWNKKRVFKGKFSNLFPEII